MAKEVSLLQLVTKSEQQGSQANGEATQDVVTNAANYDTKESLFHQIDDNRRLLQLVEEALARLDDGSYGQCVACHEEVQQKRLDAVPWAPHCIECQEKHEQGLL